VTLLAGSDAPNVCISQGYSLHRELQLLVEAGLSPQEALRAATVNGARWRGRSDEGRVAVGVRADLLLLSANPLDDIRHTLRIAGVAIGGHWTEPLGPPSALPSDALIGLRSRLPGACGGFYPPRQGPAPHRSPGSRRADCQGPK
jgi:hypothetical protein